MNRRTFVSSCLGAAVPGLGHLTGGLAGKSPRHPNIVFIYADDLGYGDLSCYGATRVRTPNIDRLAERGIRFTDAHSSAATCTPSRYSMLTGEYAFRVEGARILPGDAPLLIRPGRATLPSILKDRGYRTAAVGKWHLGLGDGHIDWNGEIKPGPLEVGFDESFIIPATGDRVPCVYVDNHRVAGLDPRDPIRVSYKGPLDDQPTGATHPELLKMLPSHGHDMTIVNGISRIGYMSGGKTALWKDEEMANVLTRRATSFIQARATEPFFLYFSTHEIHVPRVPHARFASATPMGPRGNVIAELDWCVGRIVETLRRSNMLDRTLIILTSDNGAVVDDGYRDEAVDRLGTHRPNGALRGGKYSLFEGGTRVPFIVHWPGQLKPGVSDALVGQLDLARSLAALTGAPLPAQAAPDSENVLPALLGESHRGRELLVEQGPSLSLRAGKWKYISPLAGPRIDKNVNIELGADLRPQLYDLSRDIGETQNLAARYPERVNEMDGILRKIRSAPPVR
jgi:arylsulfatase A-like enzyme